MPSQTKIIKVLALSVSFFLGSANDAEAEIYGSLGPSVTFIKSSRLYTPALFLTFVGPSADVSFAPTDNMFLESKVASGFSTFGPSYLFQAQESLGYRWRKQNRAFGVSAGIGGALVNFCTTCHSTQSVIWLYLPISGEFQIFPPNFPYVGAKFSIDGTIGEQERSVGGSVKILFGSL